MTLPSLLLGAVLPQRHPRLQRRHLPPVEPHPRPLRLHERLGLACPLGASLGCRVVGCVPQHTASLASQCPTRRQAGQLTPAPAPLGNW